MMGNRIPDELSQLLDTIWTDNTYEYARNRTETNLTSLDIPALTLLEAASFEIQDRHLKRVLEDIPSQMKIISSEKRFRSNIRWIRRDKIKTLLQQMIQSSGKSSAYDTLLDRDLVIRLTTPYLRSIDYCEILSSDAWDILSLPYVKKQFDEWIWWDHLDERLRKTFSEVDNKIVQRALLQALTYYSEALTNVRNNTQERIIKALFIHKESQTGAVGDIVLSFYKGKQDGDIVRCENSGWEKLIGNIKVAAIQLANEQFHPQDWVDPNEDVGLYMYIDDYPGSRSLASGVFYGDSIALAVGAGIAAYYTNASWVFDPKQQDVMQAFTGNLSIAETITPVNGFEDYGKPYAACLQEIERVFVPSKNALEAEGQIKKARQDGANINTHVHAVDTLKDVLKAIRNTSISVSGVVDNPVIAYKKQEIEEYTQAKLRVFGEEYCRPEYLLDQFWHKVNRCPKGYIYLKATGGVGKTFFIGGLEQEHQKEKTTVLCYYVHSGKASHPKVFSMWLRNAVSEKLGIGISDPPLDSQYPEEIQKQFASFLEAIMKTAELGRLIIAIDGLDEISMSLDQRISITDLLPSVDLLPLGCCFLLTSREELSAKAQADIDHLRLSGGNGFQDMAIDPENSANQMLIRSYIEQTLPEVWRTPENIKIILDRAKGVFLYAFHICTGLKSGVFENVASLPKEGQFYSVYLECLKDHFGREHFEAVHLRILLLLAATQRSVTLDQLQNWGLPKEKLQKAISEIADFLKIHRGIHWSDSLLDDDTETRYEIAHLEFVRFVQENTSTYKTLYLNAHATIGSLGLEKHKGKWDSLDGEKNEDVYDLLYVPLHLHVAGPDYVTEGVELLRDPNYIERCFRLLQNADTKKCWSLVLEISEVALVGLAQLIDQDGHFGLELHRGQTLLYRGTAFGNLNQFEESQKSFDMALECTRIGRQKKLATLNVDELEQYLWAQKGFKYYMMGRASEALECFERAEEILLRGGLNHSNGEQASLYANYLNMKAIIIDDLGSYERALASSDGAIDLIENLPDPLEKKDTLAGVLINRGVMMRSVGKYQEGYEACALGVNILRELAGQLPEYRILLVWGLGNQAGMLLHLGRNQEALINTNEAIGIARQLPEQDADLKSKLAMVLQQKENALYHLNRFEDALHTCNESIALFKTVVTEDNPTIDTIEMARVMYHKARTFRALEKSQDALRAVGEALRWQVVCLDSGMGVKQIWADIIGSFDFRLETLLDLRELPQFMAGIDQYMQCYGEKDKEWIIEKYINYHIKNMMELPESIWDDIIQSQDRIAAVVGVAQHLFKIERRIKSWGFEQNAIEIRKFGFSILGNLHSKIWTQALNAKNQGEPSVALEYWREIITLSSSLSKQKENELIRNPTFRVAQAYIESGDSLRRMGKLPDALKYLNLVLDSCRANSNNDPHLALQTGMAQMNRGLVFFQMEQYQEACVCLENSLQILRSARNLNIPEGENNTTPEAWYDEWDNEIAFVLMNCGDTFFRMDRCREALGFLNESVCITKRLIGNNKYSIKDRKLKIQEMVKALKCKSETLLDLDRFDEALTCIDEALELYSNGISSKGDGVLVAQLLHCKGNVLIRREDFEQALEYFNRGIEIAVEITENGTITFYAQSLIGLFYGKALCIDSLEQPQTDDIMDTCNTALIWLDKCVKSDYLDPLIQCQELWLCRFYVLKSLGRTEDAVYELNRLLAIIEFALMSESVENRHVMMVEMLIKQISDLLEESDVQMSNQINSKITLIRELIKNVGSIESVA